jgi:MoxR-like ATPase
MALPSIQELMRPALEAHQDADALRASDLVARMVPLFSMTREEQEERQPSGDNTLVQRINWARDNLVRLGLLERPEHGVTRITEQGRKIAVSDTVINQPPGDWAAKPVSRESVLAAIAEFAREGRDETLSRHGYRRALDYVVLHEGREYDAKALYGIAYGIEYPDDEPLRNRGLQGGAAVNRRLEELGFEIASRRSAARDVSEVSTGGRVWLIRAGRDGKYEQLAIDESVCLIGWSDLGAIPRDMSREALKQRIAEIWGEHRPQSLASQAGQVFRFLHDVSVGDLVVLPLMSQSGHVAVGRVTGGYQFRDDGPFEGTDAKHTRRVEWLAARLPYERFDPDLREAFGQQGTVSEIRKPNATQRIIDVVGGADASAIHLVLKWSPALGADTIERHRDMAAQQGATWWARQSKPGMTGLGDEWITKLRSQLESGSTTYVFLHGGSETWRTRLLDITTDASEVDLDLRPPEHDPAAHYSLWAKLTDFEQVDPSEITDGYVLARSGDPVTLGGLGNQTPLIIRAQTGALPGRFFILNQCKGEGAYQDTEGERYHWTSRSSGATRQLANSPGAQFVYYRPGEADDGTSKSYFGFGRIGAIEPEEIDGVAHFTATIEDFERFEQPVPFDQGPHRTAQLSVQPITRVQFEKLVRAGGNQPEMGTFDLDAIRHAAEQRGLNLAPEIYAQVLAALASGKHIILTGPPGTAKTTLAQAVAEAAQGAGQCRGYVLTTATADWTTYETIGGFRPKGANELEFEEGHFLKAIRGGQWLVIDELNRSHFDRAFGQLFTVLSGQPVVLPYQRPGQDVPLTLVPEGVPSPLENADVLEIPQSWRVIATMNVFDKTLLFEMSFALMRRFAFIEVSSPSAAVFAGLIEKAAASDPRAATLTKTLLELRSLKDLGPAVFMDLAKYLRERVALGPADDGQLLFEGFYSYLLPQFEGIDAATGEQLFTTLAPQMGSSTRRDRLRQTLNTVLGLELQAPTSEPEEGLDEDVEVEQPEP